MKDRVVSLSELGKSPEDGNLIYIALSPWGDETQAPEGRRSLTVESLLSYEKMKEIQDQDAYLKHRDAVMNHLRKIIPFLEDHIEFIDFNWTRERLLNWSYPHFFYETRFPLYWRKGIVPTRLSKRLYFTGKENFPYLGWEGEVLAGLMAAEQILAESKK
jgi:hypothetical protein